MKLTMAIALALLWISTASAQWEIIDRTDDFTGEVSRKAESAPTVVQGHPRLTTTGGISVRCVKRAKLIRLWIDSFYFGNVEDYVRKKIDTNADGKIQEWTGLITDMYDDGESSLMIPDRPQKRKFLAMLTSANTLKVRVRSHDGYAAMMDINMEGAEQAIRQVCPNYSPQQP